MTRKWIIVAAVLALGLGVMGCGLTAPTPPVTDQVPATATTRPTPRPSPTVQPAPRLSVSGDQFVVAATGEVFVPRGVNHIEITSHGDCALAVGRYDGVRMRALFDRLSGHGYNTVRMFLDTCGSPVNGIGRASGGLNPGVLDNIVDLMHAAQEHGIYLLLTSNDLPENGGYWALSDEGYVEGTFGPYRNTHYLTEGGVRSAGTYWDDLMSGLAERGAPFQALLGWQLLNEQWYFVNEPPFSLGDRSVTTANGQTYDMSSVEQKRQMANDSIIHWMEQVNDVIRSYDPEALITMGFFDSGDTLADPELGYRFNDVRTMLERAPLDFIDFHSYPGGGADISHSAQEIGLTGYDTKPVILGEFGAFRRAYSSVEIGAQVISVWMEDSCRVGFDGWLYWIYGEVDVGAADDPWGFVEGDGLIMEALAPAANPDPCDLAPPVEGAINLAFDSPATASRTEADPYGQYVPGHAADFSLQSWWSAAEGAPQWLEIDLGQASTIERVRLVNQFAGAGRHVHEVWGRRVNGEQRLLASFDVVIEQDELILERTLEQPVEGIRYVRVQSRAAPGWIIWHEVQVYGTAAD